MYKDLNFRAICLPEMCLLLKESFEALFRKILQLFTEIIIG